ncbi:MAG: glycosyltransferase family 1 protein [bacterium]|jgi:glycosyltransferase involved in cell wall biosynthesis|nr:glycosyltransferase family 1 protein [bacterium]
MRILVDIRHLNTDNVAGVGRYTQNLLNALFELETKHEYVLYSSGRTLSPFGERSARTHKHVAHIHNRTPNKLLNLKTLFTKTNTFESVGCIDHIFLPNLNIINLPEKIPVTLTIHDLSWVQYPQFFSRKMLLWHKFTKPEALIKRATNIITPSQATATRIQASWKTPASKMTPIAHGIETTFTSKMLASDHGVRSRNKLPKNFILFVGTQEPRKNLPALIDAIKRYREETRDDLHFVLAGNWGWKSHELRRQLWRQEYKTWIHHLGYVKQDELPALYRSAKATVFPSIYEGFGIPVLESMACGTPVITSHTSSLPEVGGNACIYVDPYNVQDMKDALKGLMQSKPLQQQLHQQGVKQAAQFSWEKAAQKTLKSIEQAHK